MSCFFRALVGGFVFFGLIFFVKPVHAMKVQPAMMDVSALPGASTSSIFYITNTDPVEQVYQFTIQGFLPKGDDGQQVFLPPEDVSGLPSWLYVSTSTVKLLPGSTVPVEVTFRPSGEAVPGAYQAVVFATHIDSRRQNGMVLGSRVGVLIFATVKGDIHHDLRTTSFLVERMGPHRFPENFVTVLQNQGNAHEVPRGYIAIYNIFGSLLSKLDLQGEKRAHVLPGSARRFVVEWAGMNSKDLRFSESLILEAKSFFTGWYRADLVLNDGIVGDGDRLSFFVLPWRSWSLFGVGLLVLALIKRGRRK